MEPLVALFKLRKGSPFEFAQTKSRDVALGSLVFKHNTSARCLCGIIAGSRRIQCSDLTQNVDTDSIFLA